MHASVTESPVRVFDRPGIFANQHIGGRMQISLFLECSFFFYSFPHKSTFKFRMCCSVGSAILMLLIRASIYKERWSQLKNCPQRLLCAVFRATVIKLFDCLAVFFWWQRVFAWRMMAPKFAGTQIICVTRDRTWQRNAWFSILQAHDAWFTRLTN